jgi:S-methylmethionine-dependent homocysteine/selenocysteine methylase
MTTDDRVPRLDRDRLYVGDGGLETTMIYREGIELPHFASFLLLNDERSREALRRYYGGYIEIAHRQRLGFTLDTPTWRANADWGEKLGYSAPELAEVNRAAVRFVEGIRAEHETHETPIVVCGTIGPRGDGYHPAHLMSVAEAERYHAPQVATFRDAAADMVSAFTLTYAEEAVGIVKAAAALTMPVSISFTVEADGRLPSGQSLGEAIGQVDAATNEASAFFMINCAHPGHFAAELERGGRWVARLGGIRANASRKSHAELDQSSTLDPGDPADLGAEYKRIKPRTTNVRVLGGCCGTDTRHIASICDNWLN